MFVGGGGGIALTVPMWFLSPFPPECCIFFNASACARVFACAQLPDGRVIKFGGERFEAPEALFNP